MFATQSVRAYSCWTFRRILSKNSFRPFPPNKHSYSSGGEYVQNFRLSNSKYSSFSRGGSVRSTQLPIFHVHTSDYGHNATYYMYLWILDEPFHNPSRKRTYDGYNNLRSFLRTVALQWILPEQSRRKFSATESNRQLVTMDWAVRKDGHPIGWEDKKGHVSLSLKAYCSRHVQAPHIWEEGVAGIVANYQDFLHLCDQARHRLRQPS